MRIRKIPKMSPVGTAVFILIAGFLIGSVFTFGMKHWNAPLVRNDAVYVEATFEEIEINGWKGRKGAIIRFEDHEQLNIDSSCISNDLINDLENLQRGDRVTLLVHPNSSTILEMKSVGKMLMRFDDSVNMLDSTGYWFVILGIFMYFCAALGVGSLIGRYIKARKRKQ